MTTAEPASYHDDAALLVALPRDLAAFEAFYRRYVRRVTAFAASRCSCAADVADVVAQTFVRLLSAAERYDPDRAAPAPFVLGIAANVARDLHRRQARDRTLAARLVGRELLDADECDRINAAIDAARAAAALDGELAAIPTGERQVLRLVADGHTPGQAARRLGISPTAARTRLSRARRRIRIRTADTHGDRGAAR
ncbi:MAG TPA: RNA polymerase sigma factor [Acidimicrobiales bacterium]